jgi:type III secretion protein U
VKSSTEEKSQPASEKKIRDARNKGQTARSQDLVAAIVLTVCSIYLAWVGPGLIQRMQDLFDDAAASHAMVFDEALAREAGKAIALASDIVLPLLMLTVTAVVVTSILVTRGVVFSAEPIKPQFERINPAEGIKRIASMRALIEFAKNLFKVVALAAFLISIYRWRLQEIVSASQCGMDCIARTAKHLLGPLVLTTVIAFLVTGVIDVRLQTWLFRREMRMTHGEKKRERKDTDGNPEIKRERQRLRREDRVQSAERGMQHATLVLGGADTWLIGLRYVRGVTPVPVVVAREEPGHGAAALHVAQSLNISIAEHSATLAAELARRARPGMAIPSAYFQPVADLIVKSQARGT